MTVQMDSLSVVILAAGKGTRMYSSLPKVLHCLGGRTMLDRVIHTAQQLQPDDIYVVVGHGSDLIRKQIDASVLWVEQKIQLGTGHAVKMVLPNLKPVGRTLILYGDVPLIDVDTLNPLLSLMEHQVGILTDVVENPQGYGRIIRQNDRVVAIVEEKDATPEQKAISEINTGIMVVPNHYLIRWLEQIKNDNAQGEYYLTDIIALAAADGVDVLPVGVRCSYRVQGVNNRLQLADLERIFQKTQAQELLRQGVTLMDAERFDLRGQLQHGQDVVIDVNCVFEGSIRLGNRVHIGANCVLKNVEIADDVVIDPFCHLEDCVVGYDSRIGPFARLRPGAVLQDHVHIGNFVEVKNTQVGSGSKANHLTYLGDAIIGTQTNIGAGTITCNYDGVRKHQTIIGDEVRIGSHTALVAPVTVGHRATTGAGSVITKNCPDNQLTLSRAKQVTVEHWVRPEKDK